MRVLFAGPWVGEFGWELFCWQAAIRHMAKTANFDKIFVSSSPQNEAIYADFCDEYVPYTLNSYKRNGYLCEDYVDDFDHKKYLSCKHTNVIIPPNTRICNYNTVRGWVNQPPQKFIKFGNLSADGYDIIFHCRNRRWNNKSIKFRNWSIDNWELLFSKLGTTYKIACIGTKEESFHIDGTHDLRGIPLSELCDVLRSSKILITPSSGPGHLASLCGCPHLIWSGDNNEARYTKDWNPFKTPCYYIGGSWNPDANTIYNTLMEIFHG